MSNIQRWQTISTCKFCELHTHSLSGGCCDGRGADPNNPPRKLVGLLVAFVVTGAEVRWGFGASAVV